MRNPDDTRYSNSYDIFLCGQEISSGAQRCHDPIQLQSQIKERGLDISDFQSYVTCFQHGVSPHAGSGIGLERIVYLYLGLDNVRRTSMFPRTPQRLTP